MLSILRRWLHQAVAWFRPTNGDTAEAQSIISQPRESPLPPAPQAPKVEIPPPQAARDEAPEPPPQPQAPEPEPPPQPEEPQEPQPPPPIGNRRERRRLAKWERERRKKDVFVTPKVLNEAPARKPRIKTERKVPEVKPLPPVEEVPDNVILMEGDDGTVYHERELVGEFTFRDTILEQLDMYWVYLRRMQAKDPDAYGFYKRIGATIIPHAGNQLQDGPRPMEKDEPPDTRKIKLTPWWKENRPSFGCVTYGISKQVEEYEKKELPDQPGWHHWIPKFFYFTKFTRPPPNVAPRSGGDIYKLTIWWDRPFDPKGNYKKGGGPTEFAVFLDKETISVLPMLETEFVQIRHKKGGAYHRRGEMFDIPKRAWRIPEQYRDWAKDSGETAEEKLARLFMDVARTYEYSNYGMVRVAVHNGDLTAQFVVDPARMSYFFQDRDIVYTPGGAREHCFHIVRAHERQLRNGKVSSVRLHFRGAKEFTWAGYRVTITVPERDHVPLPEFDVGCVDSYWMKRGEKWEGQPKIGEHMQNLIEGKPWSAPPS